MRVPITAGDTCKCPTGSQIEKYLSDTVTVQVESFVLVTECHQTLIACRLAVRLLIRPSQHQSDM